MNTSVMIERIAETSPRLKARGRFHLIGTGKRSSSYQPFAGGKPTYRDFGSALADFVGLSDHEHQV
jgi:hypothetical protein